jgi:hypothetical protein
MLYLIRCQLPHHRQTQNFRSKRNSTSIVHGCAMTAFGLAVNLPHKAGTIVFIVVLVILLLLEGGKRRWFSLDRS